MTYFPAKAASRTSNRRHVAKQLHPGIEGTMPHGNINRCPAIYLGLVMWDYLTCNGSYFRRSETVGRANRTILERDLVEDGIM